jgi:hypothetical protein
MLTKNFWYTILSMLSRGFMIYGMLIKLLFKRPRAYMKKYCMFSENSKLPPREGEFLWFARAIFMTADSITDFDCSTFGTLSNLLRAFLSKTREVDPISRNSKASLTEFVSGTAILWHLILLCPSELE